MNLWRLLGLALAGAAVSVLLSPRLRERRPPPPAWRIDTPVEPVEPAQPPAAAPAAAADGEQAPALH